MNKRIKELAEQSGLDIYGLGLDRNKWDTTVSKFAELIVRECINTIKETNLIDDDPVANIKKRFGVEE